MGTTTKGHQRKSHHVAVFDGEQWRTSTCLSKLVAAIKNNQAIEPRDLEIMSVDPGKVYY